MTKDKYLLELEQKLAQQEEIIKNFKKEQGASVEVFKKQKQAMENLTNSNNNLIAGHERLNQTNQQLQNEAKTNQKQLKELQTKIKELESDLAKQIDTAELATEKNQDLMAYKQKYQSLKEQTAGLVRDYNKLENTCQNQAKSLSNTKQELIAQQGKNQILENKIEELENQTQESNSLPPMVQWEQEKQELLSGFEEQKEELLTTFEKTRNEQAEQITELEQENTQLDKDLNKAVDLLESKDKTIAELQSKLAEQKKTVLYHSIPSKEPQEKEPKLYLFTCDICEQTKKSQLHLGKVNGLGIDPNKENKICSFCYKKVDLILPKREEFF